MTKIKIILLTLALIIINGLFYQRALAESVFVQGACYGNTAGEGFGYIRLWSDKGIITADGKEALTIYTDSWVTQKDKCPTIACPQDNNQYYKVSISGSGNYVYPSLFLTTSKNFPAEFKIFSTIAEEKIITIEEYNTSGNWVPLGSSGNCQRIAIKVKFSVPAQTTITPMAITTILPIVTSSPAPPSQPTLPTPPTIDNFMVGSSKFSLDKLSNFNFTTLSKITFLGKSVPNAKVTLYINSGPIVAETQADKDGNWSYTVQKPLTTGKHSMQLTTTDPQTDLTSEKSDPINFKVVQRLPAEYFPLTNFEYILSSINDKELVLYNLVIATLITLTGLAIAESAIIIFNKTKRKRRIRLLSKDPNFNKPKAIEY